jgi:hypothetical protein
MKFIVSIALIAFLTCTACDNPNNDPDPDPDPSDSEKKLADVVDDQSWVSYLPKRWVYDFEDPFSYRFLTLTFVFDAESDKVTYSKDENTSEDSFSLIYEDETWTIKIEDNFLYFLEGDSYKKKARLQIVDDYYLNYYAIYESPSANTETLYKLVRADYDERSSASVIDSSENESLIPGTWNCTDGLSVSVQSEVLDFTAQKNYYIHTYSKTDGSTSSYKYQFYIQDNILYNRQWDIPSSPNWSRMLINNDRIETYLVWEKTQDGYKPIGSPWKTYVKN